MEAFSGVMPTYICLITLKPEIIALKGPLYIVNSSGPSTEPLGKPEFNSLELGAEANTLRGGF